MGCNGTDSRYDANRIDGILSAYAGPDVPGASVMVIEAGDIVFQKSYGLARMDGAKEPSSPRTNYRLASITKQFTAMCIMMLAERGQLSYEATLSDLFSNFPGYGRDITVRHLLTHTSGLVAYEDVIPEGTTMQLRDRDVLDLMMQQTETYFPPGSQYRYSNSAYAVLAMVVEEISGTSFARFLDDNIFEPLGMTGTIAFEEGISEVAHRAYGHTATNDGFVRKDQSLTSAVLGDGGIYSSVEDLYKWDQALYTDRLVRFESLAEAFEAAPNTLHSEDAYYGFGWYVENYRGLKNLRHSGSTAGFRNDIERFPERRLTVILLTNRDGSSVRPLAEQIADAFLF